MGLDCFYVSAAQDSMHMGCIGLASSSASMPGLLFRALFLVKYVPV